MAVLQNHEEKNKGDYMYYLQTIFYDNIIGYVSIGNENCLVLVANTDDAISFKSKADAFDFYTKNKNADIFKDSYDIYIIHLEYRIIADKKIK